MKNRKYFYLIVEVKKVCYIFRILDVKWKDKITQEVQKKVRALMQLVYFSKDMEEKDLAFPFNKLIYMFLDANVKTYTAKQIEDNYSVYLDVIPNLASSNI